MLDSTLSQTTQPNPSPDFEVIKFADAQNVIQELRPINRLPEEAVAKLAELTDNLSVSAGVTVSNMVRESDYVHYLVEGTLGLVDSNNEKKILSAGSAECKTAIDRRLNGSVDLVAETNCFLARLPWSELENFLLQHAPDELSSSTLEVKEILSSTCSDWMVRLLQSDLISMLPAANIQEVLASVDVLELSPGEVVINQGDDPDHFYIIEAGKFCVFRDIQSTGRQVELATLSTGDFFGEEALITGDKRGTSVKATTKAKLLKVHGEQFKKSIVEPTIARESLDEVHERLNNGATLIDVRTSEQYKLGHVPNSINLVLQLLRINSNQLDKQSGYVVGAENQNAAAVATFLLRVRGFDVTCLNHPIASYAEKFEIALSEDTSRHGAGKTNVAELPARKKPQVEDLQDKPTLAQITKLAAEHAGRDEQPAPVEDYAHTVTGVGLADLIEELNDSYETEAEVAPAITKPETDKPHLDDVQKLLSEDVDFDVNAADTLETLDEVTQPPKKENSETLKQAEIDAEVARLLDFETKKLRAKFEKDLQEKLSKNKRAALQALHAHKEKLDLQFRAKQKTLLANSQKLIALANKISQQKAEVESARKALASANNKPAQSNLSSE